MKFNNTLMLIGLIALLVPILIHLLNRSRAKILDWGAMRFLLASLTSQNRRILVEEVILLTLRCLLVAGVVMAMAMPFLPSRSRVPWAIALPAFLGAAISLGVATAMWHHRKARWGMLLTALLLGAVAATASGIEQWWQALKLARGRGERDVAILLDASMSMTLNVEGKTNFARAVDEARAIVAACKPGDAVSLFLAGPVPRAVIATPTADRQELATALEGLTPLGGTMSVLEALNAAAGSLDQGFNVTKKIVLITDGQNVGWDTRSEARWRFLAEGLKGMKSPPQIICRRLPVPKVVRNAAIADLTFSRKVVGADRSVRINVKVTNTGTMPLRPQSVELSVDGTKVASEKFATDIAPRAAETVRFDHRFEHPGPRLVSARIALQDDLPADNAADRVLTVVEKLPVLLVDGVPSPSPLGGAAAFIELGLMPGGEAEEDEPTEADVPEDLPPEKEKAKDPALKEEPAEPRSKAVEELRFLVEPTVVPLPEIGSVKSFRDYAAVVLANVATLPASVANDLAGYVQSGGGLLVAPGPRADPKFYNAWATASSAPVMPASLAQPRDVHESPVRLTPRSFSHPALQLLSDVQASDTTLALVKSYWKLDADERDSDVRVGGRLASGEPFVVERKLGKGYVLLAATTLDPAGSNLPALKSFVPLLHEAVYYLASPMMLEPNVAPGTEVTLELRARGGAGGVRGGGGLRAEYFEGRNFEQLRDARTDPTINFEWGKNRPAPTVSADGFSVRWTGFVVPRFSERITFHVTADDGVRLWVDGKLLVDAWRGQNPTEYFATLPLEAGRRYPLKMEFFEDTGDATARLLWSSDRQRREAIPQSQLQPAGAAASEAPETQAAEVLTPSQRRCPATLALDNGLLRVSFAETQEPGLYTLALPPALARTYAPEGAKGNAIPFVALSRIEESSLDVLTATDMELPKRSLAERNLDLFETERTDEAAAEATGGVAGEDLWKYFIIGALLALLGEIAVGRWIAVQRRLGAAPTVLFGSEVVDVQTFRDRAQQLLRVPNASEPVPKS
ncbi:MAG: VWA domain-containing protein [Planctomycetes bacterium]|nr:VWA domain-containing protein [Planctomycetota bacterium]